MEDVLGDGDALVVDGQRLAVERRDVVGDRLQPLLQRRRVVANDDSGRGRVHPHQLEGVRTDLRKVERRDDEKELRV